MGAVSVLDVTASRQMLESRQIDVRWAVNVAAITVKPPVEYHVDVLASDGRVLANKLVPGGSFSLFNGVKNERVEMPYDPAWGPAKNLRVRVEAWEKTIGWHKTSERSVQVRDTFFAPRPEGGEGVISELMPDINAKTGIALGLGVVALVAVAVIATQGASAVRAVRGPAPSGP